ncbi:MAG: valine--tRNA ligase [Candidatus Aenigmarchaeota archaeon]|nr:valine--tRNA ligase [Candidatus Aenigmarchaeota archaeon]
MQPRIEASRWDKSLEKPIYEEWIRKHSYSFNRKSGRPIFSIDTPPPYVNTPIHIGHATSYVLMDFFARFRRMAGYEVLFPLGLDRNGLPIEIAAEKRFGVRMADTEREKFLEMCRLVLEESSKASIESYMRLGISFNSWDHGSRPGDIYYTDSEEYRRQTQQSFIDLWNAGLIYEAKRVNSFCPGCRTTIADAEVSYREGEADFNIIKFSVKGSGKEILIGTTRPELLCSCAMIIFNPKDSRWKGLDEKTAITPIYGKEVPIKKHPMADMEKGTGLVMMCSFGDLNDIRFFREMSLEPIIAINPDGRLNEKSGFLKGLSVKQARKSIIEELKKRSLLLEQKKVLQNTPICERSRDEIEFIELPELYLRQVELKDKIKGIAKGTAFYSKESRKLLLDWIDSITIDWPISRRRYYATEVPLWYCSRCRKPAVPKGGKYYRPWKERLEEKCSCGSEEFTGETRVFDTWFDSSISPLYILKYYSDRQFFDSCSPCSLRPQGKEIVRTWLYYTLLKCYLLTGKGIFKDIWIHYHVLDDKGRKMSKSMGNVIDPNSILDRFGAEPFRLWCAVEGNLARSDFKCSFERITGESKTLTKLWNLARFISAFRTVKEARNLTQLDMLAINEADRLAADAGKNYSKYEFHLPAARIKSFIWDFFASHYVEAVKTRAYNSDGSFTKEEQEAAIYTLSYCLDITLKLLAPILPFITQSIYKQLHGSDIHSEPFPETKGKAAKIPFSAEEFMLLNSHIWKAKRQAGKSLREPLKRLVAEKKFQGIMKDLKAAHNAATVGTGKTSVEL